MKKISFLAVALLSLHSYSYGMKRAQDFPYFPLEESEKKQKIELNIISDQDNDATTSLQSNDAHVNQWAYELSLIEPYDTTKDPQKDYFYVQFDEDDCKKLVVVPRKLAEQTGYFQALLHAQFTKDGIGTRESPINLTGAFSAKTFKIAMQCLKNKDNVNALTPCFPQYPSEIYDLLLVLDYFQISHSSLENEKKFIDFLGIHYQKSLHIYVDHFKEIAYLENADDLPNNYACITTNIKKHFQNLFLNKKQLSLVDQHFTKQNYQMEARINSDIIKIDPTKKCSSYLQIITDPSLPSSIRLDVVYPVQNNTCYYTTFGVFNNPKNISISNSVINLPFDQTKKDISIKNAAHLYKCKGDIILTYPNNSSQAKKRALTDIELDKINISPNGKYELIFFRKRIETTAGTVKKRAYAEYHICLVSRDKREIVMSLIRDINPIKTSVGTVSRCKGIFSDDSTKFACAPLEFCMMMKDDHPNGNVHPITANDICLYKIDEESDSKVILTNILKMPQGKVTNMLFNKDNSMLAASCTLFDSKKSRIIYLWELAANNAQIKHVLKFDRISTMAFSPDSSKHNGMLIVGDKRDNQTFLSIYDAISGEKIFSKIFWKTPDFKLYNIACNADISKIAVFIKTNGVYKVGTISVDFDAMFKSLPSLPLIANIVLHRVQKYKEKFPDRELKDKDKRIIDASREAQILLRLHGYYS